MCPTHNYYPDVPNGTWQFIKVGASRFYPTIAYYSASYRLSSYPLRRLRVYMIIIA
nr:MAG TPA: hypothetical protein [Crassvirales sp.]